MAEVVVGRTRRQRQAANVQADFSKNVEMIRQNKQLSVDGRRNAIAQEYLSARAVLSKLQYGEANDFPEQKKALRAKLFGMPSGADPSAIIAFRDAQDRASRLTTFEDAAVLADVAVQSNDVQLLSAIIDKSLRSGWSAIVRHAASDDGDFPLASELQQLLDLDGPSSPSERAADQMAARLAFTLTKPAELDRFVNDIQLENAAASAGGETPGPKSYGGWDKDGWFTDSFGQSI